MLCGWNNSCWEYTLSFWNFLLPDIWESHEPPTGPPYTLLPASEPLALLPRWGLSSAAEPQVKAEGESARGWSPALPRPLCFGFSNITRLHGGPAWRAGRLMGEICWGLKPSELPGSSREVYSVRSRTGSEMSSSSHSLTEGPVMRSKARSLGSPWVALVPQHSVLFLISQTTHRAHHPPHQN